MEVHKMETAIDVLKGFGIILLAIGILFAIGYGAHWFFYKRDKKPTREEKADGGADHAPGGGDKHDDHGGHGSAPKSTSITVTQKFGSFVILSVSYCLILWAVKVLFPTIWTAWSGQGFWLSQALLISVILILAFIKPNNLKKLAWIPGIFAIVAVVHTIVGNFPAIQKHTLGKQKMQSMLHINVPGGSSNGKDTTYVIDTSANEYQIPVVLQKPGDKMPLEVKPYYSFVFSDPGKEFYYQGSDQDKPEVVGHGKVHKENTYTTSFTLSYKDTPITTICYFTKVPH